MKLKPVYIARDYEQRIYEAWQENKIFQANPNSPQEHYSISMPPPNETGILHIGHALFITLQDILARHARAKGYDVLWLPGTDHAALSTNAIIEKKLAEEGTNKNQIGRAKFLEITREYVASSRNTINAQIKAMGASVDWSRTRYTLDDTLNRCVKEVFVKMYNDGLIYRGNRIVNWDPALQTNISDDEIEYIEEDAKLYRFKFGPFEISTARPETKFADKYVVINPHDKRYLKYKHLDQFKAEWINGTITATVIKDEAVDPSFGTGVMTITPWHSLVDFEIAQRHNLEGQQIIGFDGRLLPIAGEFEGMTIEEARNKIVQKLDKKGLLIDIDHNYRHSIAINSRGKGIIEPQIRLQWFIDVNKRKIDWKNKKMSFKEILQEVIKNNEIKLYPKNFEKVYFHWIDNLRDWCISRQIWWGHQIPAWYLNNGDKTEVYVGLQPPQGKGWEQDPDTLDTWFSSSLWTWSTLIDPNLARDQNLTLSDLLAKSIDFQTYHPTNVLETGWDILFFWVARMIMSTIYITKQIPFKDIYLHGLVRTESGKKMSKSDPDSIIDPIKIIDQYGTDALRLALIQDMAPGKDEILGRSKIITNRNFCNKLWNVARFIQNKIKDSPVSNDSLNLKYDADHWIIRELTKTKEKYIKALDTYHFSDAYRHIYRFLNDKLADWYIESSKTNSNSNLLKYCLEETLILSHPIAPFVTEAIWGTEEHSKNGLLATQGYENIVNYNQQKAQHFDDIMVIVSEVRQLIKNLETTNLNLSTKSDFILTNTKLIKNLSGVNEIKNDSRPTPFKLKNSKHTIYINIATSLVRAYQVKLKNSLANQEQIAKNLKNRLENQDYLKKAPQELVNQTKSQLQLALDKMQNIQDELNIFVY